MNLFLVLTFVICVVVCVADGYSAKPLRRRTLRERRRIIKTRKQTPHTDDTIEKTLASLLANTVPVRTAKRIKVSASHPFPPLKDVESFPLHEGNQDVTYSPPKSSLRSVQASRDSSYRMSMRQQSENASKNAPVLVVSELLPVGDVYQPLAEESVHVGSSKISRKPCCQATHCGI